MTRRGVGAELHDVHDRWMLSYAELWRLHKLVCYDHEAHMGNFFEDYGAVTRERDDARAEVARLRTRLTELEDVAQVAEAREREGAATRYAREHASPERQRATDIDEGRLQRAGPRRGR